MAKKAKTRSLFEYSEKMSKISKIGDPLEKLNSNIPWQKIFYPILSKLKKTEKAKEENLGGRPRYPEEMMLKVIILQRAYNLSDEQTEYQINDRLSFQRFLGLDISCDVPDYTTIWNFRETLTNKNLIEKLFNRFNRFLNEQGIIMKDGSIIDASFVDVPKQRNSRKENDQIKEDKIPDDWSDKKKSHKDTDARWATKNKEVHFGYKNHVKVDLGSKIITKYTTTTANEHDSQEIGNLIDEDDRDKKLYADSAYRSESIETLLKKKGIQSMIHEKGYRNKPLSEKQKKLNKQKSKKRVRVEHVFGFMDNSMDASMIRCIGEVRSAGVIGLMNLTYNLFRFTQIRKSLA